MNKENTKFSLVLSTIIGTLLLSPASLALKETNANYKVTTGDTLSTIAERQYGNWIKWKDLFSWNQDKIQDPHWIYPGQRLTLLGGQEFDLYANNSKNGASVSSSSSTRRRGRSNEWRLLPQQKWEQFVYKVAPEVDPQGFDRRSKVGRRFANHTNPSIQIASDRLAIHGEIIHARSEGSKIFLGEQVFIRADEELQMGSVYSITSGPQNLPSKRDGRVGFGYDLMGKVRIIGVRDGVFIGTIISMRHPIERHQLLIPEVKSFNIGRPVAAPSAMVGHVLVTEDMKEEMLYEHRLVFIDLGAQDGVTPGMIFRNYLHRDPVTKEEITSKDFLIQAELQVVDVQDKFSTALILNGRSAMHMDDEVVALTDLSDFRRSMGMQSLIQDASGPATLDDLDQMDDTQGLGEKENSELHQLENYKNPYPDNEIRREVIHPDQSMPGVGEEPAPNDGTTTAPSTAPETAPEVPTENTGDVPADVVPSDIPADMPADAPVDTPVDSTIPSDPTPETTLEAVPESSVEAAPVNEGINETIPEVPPSIDAELDGPEKTVIESSSDAPKGAAPVKEQSRTSPP